MYSIADVVANNIVGMDARNATTVLTANVNDAQPVKDIINAAFG